MADTLIEAQGARPSGVAETLRAVLARAEGGEITAETLLASFGPRAFGLLLILVNLPNVILAPPVLAGIAAVPTAVFGAQLLAGRRHPWLPAALLRQRLAAGALARVLAVSGPWLDRLETFGRPRLAWAAGPAALRLLGVFALSCALIVLIPVPGTNVLPALSLVVIAVGILRQDGLLVLAGAILGVAGALIALIAAGLAIELFRWAWQVVQG